jgi:hypothetical protein
MARDDGLRAEFGDLIGQDVVTAPGLYRFSLSSRDPRINVTGWLVGKPTEGVPRPRYTQHERPGDFDLLQYVSHDLFEQTIPIKFGDGTDSVEGRIAQLERLLRRTAKNGEPPIVKAAGHGVLHPEYNWRVVGLDPVDDRILFFTGQNDRRLYVANVILRQQVAENVLTESISKSRRRDAGAGLRNRTVTVREGERTLYQVAKRYFRDPSAAREIAVANGITLSTRLKAGRKLRLP